MYYQKINHTYIINIASLLDAVPTQGHRSRSKPILQIRTLVTGKGMPTNSITKTSFLPMLKGGMEVKVFFALLN